ncbi:hypothetical protein, partial [Klebsiella pneumoniae]|uniref:hypothetical protein n=1 Tax=Klebsiella pneumoniae TaxID=573 RepID=UPI0035B300A7
LTGGVFNFVGGLGGITVPLVIGYLAQDYGFGPALVYISVVAFCAPRPASSLFSPAYPPANQTAGRQKTRRGRAPWS